MFYFNLGNGGNEVLKDTLFMKVFYKSVNIIRTNIENCNFIQCNYIYMEISTKLPIQCKEEIGINLNKWVNTLNMFVDLF